LLMSQLGKGSIYGKTYIIEAKLRAGIKLSISDQQWYKNHCIIRSDLSMMMQDMRRFLTQSDNEIRLISLSSPEADNFMRMLSFLDEFIAFLEALVREGETLGDHSIDEDEIYRVAFTANQKVKLIGLDENPWKGIPICRFVEDDEISIQESAPKEHPVSQNEKLLESVVILAEPEKSVQQPMVVEEEKVKTCEKESYNACDQLIHAAESSYHDQVIHYLSSTAQIVPRVNQFNLNVRPISVEKMELRRVKYRQKLEDYYCNPQLSLIKVRDYMGHFDPGTNLLEYIPTSIEKQETYDEHVT